MISILFDLVTLYIWSLLCVILLSINSILTCLACAVHSKLLTEIFVV